VHRQFAFTIALLEGTDVVHSVGLFVEQALAVVLAWKALGEPVRTTRQTLAKELRSLAATGWIIQQYGRIKIRSMAKLQETAAAG
jgi:hypothetical protein